QTRFTLPIAAAHILPPGIPSERAALAAQMETALNATWDAAAGIGERIAVVGAGAIGCLVAYLCTRLPGSEVTLIDRDAGRRPVAAALGVGFAIAGEALPQGALPEDCDLVFHASGEAEGLALALSLAGFEGKVIELSWYGSKAVALGLGGAFHSRRLTIAASQVGSVAPSRPARWDHARRLDLALALTADPRLDVLVRAG